MKSDETMTNFVHKLGIVYFRNVDSNYDRMFIKSLATVNSKSLKSVAEQILQQFLNSDSTQTVIVCNKKKINKVAKDFAKFGFRVKVYQSFEETASLPK